MTQFTACGTAPSEANWEIAVTNTDTSTLPPGAIWSNIQAEVNLANWSNFSPGTADWFSPCGGSSYAPSQYFAVYYQGTLVFANGIDAPVCRSPHGSNVVTGYTLPPTSTHVVPVAPTSVIQVNVGLPVRDLSGLETVINHASDPLNPTYRQWVSPRTFMSTYAPLATDYAILTAWAQAQGFQVVAYPNNVGLDVLGTAAMVERAFYVNLVTATRPDGSTYYRPDRQPTINLPLAIEGLCGLDSYPVLSSATLRTGPAPGTFGTNDVRNAYLGTAMSASACSGLTGIGQSIGVYAPSGVSLADIRTFVTASGLPLSDVPSQKSVPCGAPGEFACPSFIPIYAGGEPSIDVETVFAIARDAHVTAYEGSNFDSVLTVMSQDVDVSILSFSTSSNPVDAHASTLITVLASQGKSIFMFSGDGAALEPPSMSCAPNDADVVPVPSEVPGYVTSSQSLPFSTNVGGTQLIPSVPSAK